MQGPRPGSDLASLDLGLGPGPQRSEHFNSWDHGFCPWRDWSYQSQGCSVFGLWHPWDFLFPLCNIALFSFLLTLSIFFSSRRYCASLKTCLVESTSLYKTSWPQLSIFIFWPSNNLLVQLRKQVEQALKRKPAGGSPPWSLLQLLTLVPCFDLIPWLLLMRDCSLQGKTNHPLPNLFCLFSFCQCFACIYVIAPCVCPQVALGHRLYHGNRKQVKTTHLLLTWSPLQRPCCLVASHSQVLGRALRWRSQ